MKTKISRQLTVALALATLACEDLGIETEAVGLDPTEPPEGRRLPVVEYTTLEIAERTSRAVEPSPLPTPGDAMAKALYGRNRKERRQAAAEERRAARKR